MFGLTDEKGDPLVTMQARAALACLAACAAFGTARAMPTPYECEKLRDTCCTLQQTKCWVPGNEEKCTNAHVCSGCFGIELVPGDLEKATICRATAAKVTARPANAEFVLTPAPGAAPVYLTPIPDSIALSTDCKAVCDQYSNCMEDIVDDRVANLGPDDTIEERDEHCKANHEAYVTRKPTDAMEVSFEMDLGGMTIAMGSGTDLGFDPCEHNGNYGYDCGFNDGTDQDYSNNIESDQEDSNNIQYFLPKMGGLDLASSISDTYIPSVEPVDGKPHPEGLSVSASADDDLTVSVGATANGDAMSTNGVSVGSSAVGDLSVSYSEESGGNTYQVTAVNPCFAKCASAEDANEFTPLQYTAMGLGGFVAVTATAYTVMNYGPRVVTYASAAAKPLTPFPGGLDSQMLL